MNKIYSNPDVTNIQHSYQKSKNSKPKERFSLIPATIQIGTVYTLTSLMIINSSIFVQAESLNLKQKYSVQIENVKTEGIATGKLTKLKKAKEIFDGCVKNQQSWADCLAIFKKDPMMTADRIASILDPYAERLQRIEKRQELILQNQQRKKDMEQEYSRKPDPDMDSVENKRRPPKKARKKIVHTVYTSTKSSRRKQAVRSRILKTKKSRTTIKRKCRTSNNHSWTIDNRVIFTKNNCK